MGFAGIYGGALSGTSADAIDVAFLEFDERGRIRRTVAARSFPLDGHLAQRVHDCGPDTPLATVQALDTSLADAFATAIDRTRVEAEVGDEVRAVGSHGQTIWHTGRETAPAASVQIADPNRIAARCRLPVVADFRRRDLAEGGEGAPLVPAFHAHCWHCPGRDQAVLNLGGIANLTLLPGEGSVRGFDAGPANTLLDYWARKHLGNRFDEGGAWAASGRLLPALLERLEGDAYFTKRPPKSTGPEHFSPEWLNGQLEGDERPEDVQATLTELTARTVSRSLERWYDTAPLDLWVCGGGVHNKYLMERLARHCSKCRVANTEALGLHPDFVEAAAFAWLAWAHIAGIPGNLPAVTGARRPAILGGLYPP